MKVFEGCRVFSSDSDCWKTRVSFAVMQCGMLTIPFHQQLFNFWFRVSFLLRLHSQS